jgi:hypothetical protein
MINSAQAVFTAKVIALMRSTPLAVLPAELDEERSPRKSELMQNYIFALISFQNPQLSGSENSRRSTIRFKH